MSRERWTQVEVRPPLPPPERPSIGAALARFVGWLIVAGIVLAFVLYCLHSPLRQGMPEPGTAVNRECRAPAGATGPEYDVRSGVPVDRYCLANHPFEPYP